MQNKYFYSRLNNDTQEISMGFRSFQKQKKIHGFNARYLQIKEAHQSIKC